MRLLRRQCSRTDSSRTRRQFSRAGLGYTAYNSGNFFVMPLAEVLGWSVLSGQEFNPNTGGAVSAAGDTIVNGKLGVRAGGQRQDFYVGYGRALTGERWYQDIWR